MDMLDPTRASHEPAKPNEASPHLYDFIDRAQIAMPAAALWRRACWW